MAAKKEIIMTPEGYKRLEQELEELKTVRRKEVAERIKVALSFGDLSENSEYDEAKNEQAIVEGRIAELEAQIKNARILDEDVGTETINVGCTVQLKDLDLKKEVTYEISGALDADPRNGKISDESPIGKTLLGHRVGDKVEVEIPSGIKNFKVLKISRSGR